MAGILRRTLLFFALSALFFPFGVQAGSLDDYYLNQFAALYDSHQRAALAATAAPVGGSAERCLTPLYHNVRRDWVSLSAGTQKTLAKYLGKPAVENFLHYPSAQGHFTIHYMTSGADAPPLVDENGNGYPDWVETVAAEFEFVYDRETGQVVDGGMAYNPAPTAGASYDVFLLDLSLTKRFGYTNSDTAAAPGFNNSYTSYIVIDKDFTSALYYPYTGIKGLQITAAHEYHHAIQYGYNYYFDIWYAEATSMWIEDEVYDSINQIYTTVNLSKYLNHSSTMSLDTSDLIAPDGGYGRWIFNRHLAERHGVGVVKDIWERLALLNSPGGTDIPVLPVIDDTLRDPLKGYGSTLNYDFLLFAQKLYVRNWTTHTDEIDMIPAIVPVTSYTGYPVGSDTVPTPFATLPHNAFAYFTFSPSATAPQDLVLAVSKNNGVEAAAFKKTAGGGVTPYGFDPVTGTITIAGFNASDTAEVALLMANTDASDGKSAKFITGSAPPVDPGDINNDREVNMADAILGLQIAAGMNTTGKTVIHGAEVSGDGKIGHAEVIFIFQKAAGIR